MISIVYNVRVTTVDGFANLEMEKDKQSFVPREDDTLLVTDYPQLPESSIEADVVEVVYDPINEVAHVFAVTDLNLSDGHKIDTIIESAKEDGWQKVDVNYHDGREHTDQPDQDPVCTQNNKS